MEPDPVRLMELLAVACRLSLHEFCEVMRQEFRLPDFACDFEDATEWGAARADGIEYNVSRPFRRGTLARWDRTVPAGCNFGVSLLVCQDAPPAADAAWAFAELVPRVAQPLADRIGCRVHHHRTWLGAGRNVPRRRVFRPHRGEPTATHGR